MRALRRRVPAEVSRQVRSREKVVAWAVRAGSESSYVTATVNALYLDEVRLPWHRIRTATWEDPVLDLQVLQADGIRARPTRVELAEAGDLPAAVRDRVTGSVVVSERVDLGEAAGALLIARRDSDDGSIRWTVVFDAGLDPADVELRSAVDQALTRLRDSLGI